jgi:hypothetical protein
MRLTLTSAGFAGVPAWRRNVAGAESRRGYFNSDNGTDMPGDDVVVRGRERSPRARWCSACPSTSTSISISAIA